MAAKLDLGARVVTNAFYAEHGAFTKLVVKHLHARCNAVRWRCGLFGYRARCKTALSPIVISTTSY
jgi:hypothetical protein